jgi:hypothetical protein
MNRRLVFLISAGVALLAGMNAGLLVISAAPFPQPPPPLLRRRR